MCIYCETVVNCVILRNILLGFVMRCVVFIEIYRYMHRYTDFIKLIYVILLTFL